MAFSFSHSAAHARQNGPGHPCPVVSNSLKRASMTAISSLAAAISVLRASASSVATAEPDPRKGSRHPPPPELRFRPPPQAAPPRPMPLNKPLQGNLRVLVVCPQGPRPRPLRGPAPDGPVRSNPGMIMLLSETGPVPVSLSLSCFSGLFSRTSLVRAWCSKVQRSCPVSKPPRLPKHLRLPMESSVSRAPESVPPTSN